MKPNIGGAGKVICESSDDFVNRLIRSHVKRPDAALKMLSGIGRRSL
jgi:hypothetical protein